MPGRTRHSKEIRHGSVNGAMFAAPVHYSAKRQGAELSMDGMDGMDVLRVESGKTAEVWLFSVVQEGEAAFWNGN